MKRRPGCFCKVCGCSISGHGKTGCCMRCAQKQRLRHGSPSRKKVETIQASVIAGIKANMKTYGIHRQCLYCYFPCKQYAALNSEVVYCPKIEKESECQQ